MARFITGISLSLTIAAVAGIVTVVPVSDAAAGQRYHRGGYGHHGGYYGGGDLLGAGIAGFLIGSIIAPPVYAAPPVVYLPPEPVYVYPEPAYVVPPVYPPAPVYGSGYRTPYSEYETSGYPAGDVGVVGGPPNVVTYEESVGSIPPVAGVEPWSPAWYDYCRGRFRSFDSKSGTYMGYDGQRHFCIVR